MNEQSTHLVQAVRGPLILITLGVLFVFDRFTEFRFSQTWPVLLIVIGVLRLVGGPRRRYRDHSQQPPAIPGATPWPGRTPPPQPQPPAPSSSPSPRYANSQYRDNPPPQPGPEARK